MAFDMYNATPCLVFCAKATLNIHIIRFSYFQKHYSVVSMTCRAD